MCRCNRCHDHAIRGKQETVIEIYTKLHRDVSSLLKVTLLWTAIGVVSNASEFEAVVNYVPPPPRALHSAAVRQEEGSNFDIEDRSCI